MGTVSPLPTHVTRAAPRPSGRRRRLKRAALGVAWVFVSPLVGLSRLEAALFGPDCQRMFALGKELLAFFPGLLGCFLRLAYYWSTCHAVSPDASFAIGSMVSRREVSLGPGSVVGAHTIIGRAEIGSDVLIAARVSIFSDRYLHGRPDARVSGDTEAEESALVRIGDGCWIGENAVVMASLGARCTVAAGAVVLKPAGEGTTLMGNPARRVNL
jgi:virginiamycin A acetyltransferase